MLMEKYKKICRLFLVGVLLTLGYIPTYTYLKYIFPSKYRYVIWMPRIFSVVSVIYVVLCLMYPGYVKFSKKSLEGPSDVPYKYCGICSQYKPERTHHCRACKRCIMKMDHHCYWIGTCVNYYNIGHFIRFLLFGFLTSLFVVFGSTFYIYRFRNGNMENSYYFYGSLTYGFFVGSLFMYISAVHLYNQIGQVLKNMTYIEYLNMDEKGPLVSPYDMGIYRNLEDAFGPIYLFYLWMPSGNGIEFPNRYEEKYVVPSMDYKEMILDIE